MLQPVTPARALLLLLEVKAAEALPAPGRSITVVARPGEPLPEMRVAAKSMADGRPEFKPLGIHPRGFPEGELRVSQQLRAELLRVRAS